MTTITVTERTRRRLAGYKGGDRTFDDLLNKMMDEIDLEGFMAEDIAEHHRILNDPNEEWVDGLKVAAWLRGERKTFPPTIRRGPRKRVSGRNAKTSQKRV